MELNFFHVYYSFAFLTFSVNCWLIHFDHFLIRVSLNINNNLHVSFKVIVPCSICCKDILRVSVFLFEETLTKCSCIWICEFLSFVISSTVFMTFLSLGLIYSHLYFLKFKKMCCIALHLIFFIPSGITQL